MPYYYKDKSTNKIWSNAKIEGAKPIKEAYRYYSMLDTTGTPGQGFQLESFYIKDGSVPWFDVVANDGSDYNPNYEIDVHYGYMPVIRLCNSSISGKYYIDNGNYVIPYGMTPMLYKTEIFKEVNSEFSAEHTMVDYSKGGKVSWRMSEENLRYFQPIDIGPTTEKLNVTANSAHNFKTEFKQINDVFRTHLFFYPWENAPYTLSQAYGYFINSKPDYNTGYNAFGFTETHNVTGDEYAPANFTLTVSSVSSVGYNKLKVKMDALYLYLNGSALSPSPSYNKEYVNNINSFSADSLNSGTTPYCQALFYAINDNSNWSIPNIDTYTSSTCVGKGEIYSNLSKPVHNTVASNSGKMVVSNTAEYTVTTIPYNDCTVKEIQELSNINVWNHMILQQVVDNVGLTSTFSKFKFYNKRTGKTFQGFIPTDTIKYVTANNFRDIGYEYKSWDNSNWNESIPSTTSINGCYSSADADETDFPNYRQLFFNNDTSASGNMWETNFTASDTPLKSLSSNWLMYSDTNNRNNPYYYGHTVTAGNISTATRLGIIPNTTFDLIYKNSLYDKYKNVMPDLSTEQQYKTTGYSPSAGICYSYTNVKLEHTIDLSSMSGNYLHIAYPFITVFNNNQGLLEQMIMTYEAE